MSSGVDRTVGLVWVVLENDHSFPIWIVDEIFDLYL